MGYTGYGEYLNNRYRRREKNKKWNGGNINKN